MPPSLGGSSLCSIDESRSVLGRTQQSERGGGKSKDLVGVSGLYEAMVLGTMEVIVGVLGPEDLGPEPH